MKIPMTTLVEFTNYLVEYLGYLHLGFDEYTGESHYTDQEHLNTPDVVVANDGHLWLVFDDKRISVANTQMARMVVEFLLRNPNIDFEVHTGYPFD